MLLIYSIDWGYSWEASLELFSQAKWPSISPLTECFMQFFFYRRRSFSILRHFEQKLRREQSSYQLKVKAVNEYYFFLNFHLFNIIFLTMVSHEEFAIRLFVAMHVASLQASLVINILKDLASNLLHLFFPHARHQLNISLVLAWYQPSVVFPKSSSICHFLPSTIKM